MYRVVDIHVHVPGGYCAIALASVRLHVALKMLLAVAGEAGSEMFGVIVMLAI
jgi:hypothetical protein